jgi:hypothetical protein
MSIPDSDAPWEPLGHRDESSAPEGWVLVQCGEELRCQEVVAYYDFAHGEWFRSIWLDGDEIFDPKNVVPIAKLMGGG